MIGFVEGFMLIYASCKQEWLERGPTLNFIVDFLRELAEFSYIEKTDIYLVLLVAVITTILRYIVTKSILVPLANYYQFTPKDRIKYPESCWKLAFYTSAYVGESYLIYYKYPEFLTHTEYQWNGWHKGMVVQSDIYTLYIIQGGFYFHSIFGTIFMDMWRADSVLMIMHHVLTLALIMFSLAIRYHRIGLVVLFLHDIADVCLESTKIGTCFKNRTKDPHPLAEKWVILGFIAFAGAWVSCRLYLYPLTVLYSAGHVARRVVGVHAPFYFFFNGMLWTLFGMNLWWSYFIIYLIYRILTGKSRQVEDTRELSSDESDERKNGSVKSHIVTNGVGPTKGHHQVNNKDEVSTSKHRRNDKSKAE